MQWDERSEPAGIAGVPTELLVIPGGYHAFDVIVPDAPQSRFFLEAWSGALRRAFARGEASHP
jgi:hypothetical protein